VRHNDGSPYPGVIVDVNNGNLHFNTNTDASGLYRVCGLGADRWSAVIAGSGHQL
jgi:hypothetical protein